MTHLSLTKGVSLSTDHITKSTGNKTESSINNNINITTINQDPVETQKINKIEPKPKSRPETFTNPSIKVLDEIDEKDRISDQLKELYFLRKVLDIYMNQAVMIRNRKIVCSRDDLIELIKIITSSDDVEIETSPIDVKCDCCISSEDIPIYDIEKAWVVSGTERVIFKHSFTESLSFFDRYNISLKYIKC